MKEFEVKRFCATIFDETVYEFIVNSDDIIDYQA